MKTKIPFGMKSDIFESSSKNDLAFGKSKLHEA